MWVCQPHNLCYAPCIHSVAIKEMFYGYLKKYYRTVFHFTDRHAIL